MNDVLSSFVFLTQFVIVEFIVLLSSIFWMCCFFIALSAHREAIGGFPYSCWCREWSRWFFCSKFPWKSPQHLLFFEYASCRRHFYLNLYKRITIFYSKKIYSEYIRNKIYNGFSLDECWQLFLCFAYGLNLW